MNLLQVLFPVAFQISIYFQNQIYSPLPLLITSPTTEAMLELPLVPLSPCGKERLQVRSDEWGREGERCLPLCHPMDYSPPGSSAYSCQARILEWVTISYFRRSFQARDRTCVSCISCIGRQILYHWATRESRPGLTWVDLRSLSSGRQKRKDLWIEGWQETNS